MLENILKKLSLSEKEVLVYKNLLSLDTARASLVANETGLPRQTVYSILKRLSEENVVVKSDRAGVKQFSADLNDLILVLERRSKDLERQGKLLKEEIPKLLVENKPKSLPKVKYFEGKDGVEHLFDGILDYYKKGGEKIFRGYGINKFSVGLGKYFYNMVKKRHSYGVKTRLCIGKGSDDFGITNKQNAYGRQIKHLKMDPQDAGFYLVGDRAYLFSYKDDVGVMVENKTIIELLKSSFDDHWSRIKE